MPEDGFVIAEKPLAEMGPLWLITPGQFDEVCVCVFRIDTDHERPLSEAIEERAP